jgi:hypothetical protein
MRKKLVLLAFALAAVAATSATSPASAAGPTCPQNTYPINCGTYTFCCPRGALCFCGPA